jgi:hypothetical protein
MMMERSRYLVLVWLGCSLLFAAPAFATTIHGNYNGSTIDFLGVQETTNSAGDPEPLFEAPTVIGDSLFFSPSSFLATASGGGLDQTAALLEMTLSATPGNFIETITITEAGDTFLAGGAGTATTGTFVGMSGVITVTQVNGAPIAPVFINYTGVFDQDTFALQADAGSSSWLGVASIDVASIVPNATQAIFDLDNLLFANSEAGTTALIQKKVSNALVISLPEPTTAALLGLGLLGAAAIGRRRDR